MKKNSDELKVGILIIVFAIAGFFVLYFMGDIKKETGRPFVIQFNQVGGISPGDRVRYAGVDIGKVKSVQIKPAPIWDWNFKRHEFVPRVDEDGNQLSGDQAFVTILITEESVFRGSFPIFTQKTNVTIATSLMNERWIEIKPEPGPALKKGEILLGQTPMTIEDFMLKAERAVDQIEMAAGSFNDILGDPETQRNIKLSLDNFKDLTENLKDASHTAKDKIEEITEKIALLTDNANRVLLNVDHQVSLAGGNVQGMTSDLKSFAGTLNQMAKTNEGDIRTIVQNLVATSKSLNNTIGTIEELVTKKEFSEDILATLHNIKNTSQEIEGIASDIRAVTSDGQIREDLKVAIHEARGAAEGANKLIRGVNNTLGIEESDGKDGKKSGAPRASLRKLVAMDVEVEYNKTADETVPNINAILLPEGKSGAKLGLDSAGYDNYWNLQYRHRFGNVYPRLGIVRSKLGIGADVMLGKNAGLYVDAYNPRDVQVDLTGRINVVKDFYVHGGVRDVFDTKQTVFGVGKRF